MATGMEHLRGLLHDAVRAASGVRDVGEALLAKFLDDDTRVESDGKDIIARLTSLATEYAAVGRLFIPSSILWRKPRAGETAMVVRPQHGSAPGLSYVLYGTAGADDAVPPWWGDDDCGIYASETVHVHSATGDVVLDSAVDAGKKIILNGGSLKVARVTDPVRIGTLTGQAGPYTVIFTFTAHDADGNPPTPPGPGGVTLSGVVSNAGGAQDTVA